ncbi:MAG: synthase, gamma subunit [Oscillospiraceae bacterium]|nr:synthase, gamma subunit [Oscillospiraceae bacterium]
MSGMREIKLRIKSITETQQITKAMKLISAAKLKKAKQQLEQTRPYFLEVERTMAEILSHSAGVEQGNVYFDNRKDKANRKTGIIVLTGDKSMAGGYNHNILKLADQKISMVEHPVLFIAGYIGRNYYGKKKHEMYKDFDYPVQNPTVRRAAEITNIILDEYKKGELDEVYLVFTGMVSAIKLVPQAIRLLPLSLEVLEADIGFNEGKPAVDRSMNYEPSPEAVFEVLICKYLKGVIYGAFVEAFTSEQSARMTAMDNATTNADEMLQKLTLSYNRARQAAITQEITEIVGGAAAL